MKSATASGATVIFKQGEDKPRHKDGTIFNIHVYGKLYYLHTQIDGNDNEILGHCNYDDILKLQRVVNGMQIKGKAVKPDQECEVCIQGKFVQTRSRDPDGPHGPSWSGT